VVGVSTDAARHAHQTGFARGRQAQGEALGSRGRESEHKRRALAANGPQQRQLLGIPPEAIEDGLDPRSRYEYPIGGGYGSAEDTGKNLLPHIL
jgi:hypothetical protein